MGHVRLRRLAAVVALLAACGGEPERAAESAAVQRPAAPEFSEPGVPFRFEVPAGWRVQRGRAQGEIAALVVAVPGAGPGPPMHGPVLQAATRVPGGGRVGRRAGMAEYV